MADSQAQSIVNQALALVKSHEHASALDILDLAMTGQHESDPDFEAPAGLPFSDWTAPESPFGDLLRRAFAPAEIFPDVHKLRGSLKPEFRDAGEVLDAAWEELVMPRFAARYRLWGAEAK